MIVDIYFLSGYNNRANNIIKKPEYASIAFYNEYIKKSQVDVRNFNPGDGVYTQYLLSEWTNEGTPDYVMVCQHDSTQIISRWFVTDATYDRANRYLVSLKRDTIADNYDAVMNATSYIQKGSVDDSNPLIYNDEEIGVNEIKTGQALIKNRMNCPWAIAYCSRTNDAGEAYEYKGAFALNEPIISSINGQTEFTSDNFPYRGLIGTNSVNQSIPTFTQKLNKQQSNTRYYDTYKVIADTQTSFKIDGGLLPSPAYPVITSFNKSIDFKSRLTDGYNLGTTVYAAGTYNSYSGTWTDFSKIQSINGSIYKIDNKLKVFTVKPTGSSIKTSKINAESWLGNVFKAWQDALGAVGNNAYYEIETPVDVYEISLEEYQVGNYNYSFKFEVPVTIDAPYDIIAMPYADIDWSYGSDTYHCRKSITEAFMMNLKQQYTSAVYDIQVVPYISWDSPEAIYPVTGKIVEIKQGSTPGSGNIAGFGIRLEKASFSLNLTSDNLPYDTNKKRSICLDKYRMIGPNGQGSFEWSPARNGGWSTNFTVDATLLPFNPYFNIHPVFGGLYGSNYKDYRGLVLNGDFSMTQTGSEWANYQRQNVNYQAIFNRQIDTMEFNNSIGKTQDVVQAIAGTIQGGASGAAIGAAAGGPIGAIIGGAAGTVASATAGIADIAINDSIRDRQIRDSKIMQDYNLGNIKARPVTLAKTTAINTDNTLFPVIEYYTCTDKEKTLFDRYIKWNGMTVKDIAPISNYMNVNDWTYIKATILDININDDSHVVDDINKQLQGGIRIWA